MDLIKIIIIIIVKILYNRVRSRGLHVHTGSLMYIPGPYVWSATVLRVSTVIFSPFTRSTCPYWVLNVHTGSLRMVSYCPTSFDSYFQPVHAVYMCIPGP